MVISQCFRMKILLTDMGLVQAQFRELLCRKDLHGEKKLNIVAGNDKQDSVEISQNVQRLSTDGYWDEKLENG